MLRRIRVHLAFLWISLLILNIGVVAAEVPESVQLSAPATSSGGGCYGSASYMMTQFYVPDLEEYEYFAYRGGPRFRYNPEYGDIGADSPFDVVGLGELLGYETHIAYEGVPSEALEIDRRGIDLLAKKLEDTSRDVVSLANESEALLYLKRLLAGQAFEPTVVMVVVDDYYISEDILKAVPNYPTGIHAAHFFIVTGYDSEYIYANIGFEIRVDAVKDLKIPIDHFLEAWKETTRPDMAIHWGPYFMLWQRKTGEKKSAEEVMTQLKGMARYSVANIRRFADELESGETIFFNREGMSVPFSPSECVYLTNRMVAFRGGLVEFLKRQNLMDVAAKYDEAKDAWASFANCKTMSEVVQKLREIADLEEQAQTLWGVEPSQITFGQVIQEINEAAAAVNKAQQEGRVMGLQNVEPLFEQAEAAIYDEDYDTAYSFARQAKEIADAATKPQAPSCIIATTTFGSELAPEVQFLREFRDQTVLSTFAGSQFMEVFNAWYYSFSPSFAGFIASQPVVKTVMRCVLYPLIGILHASSIAYSAFAFSPEFGVVIAGFVASSLVGIVYFTIPVAVLLAITKRLKKKTLKNGQLKLLAMLWLVSVLLMFLGEVIPSPAIMMAATASFVLIALGLSATITASKIARLFP